MGLRCRSCGQRFQWARYAQELNEDWEEMLASVPCDRL
ncbi:MAG: dual CXXC motif small (seleno)protein [Thermodesulfobacteriota bacterium]